MCNVSILIFWRVSQLVQPYLLKHLLLIQVLSAKKFQHVENLRSGGRYISKRICSQRSSTNISEMLRRRHGCWASNIPTFPQQSREADLRVHKLSKMLSMFTSYRHASLGTFVRAVQPLSSGEVQVDVRRTSRKIVAMTRDVSVQPRLSRTSMQINDAS